MKFTFPNIFYIFQNIKKYGEEEAFKKRMKIIPISMQIKNF